MTEFKPVSEGDFSTLSGFYHNCNYGLFEYSAGTKVFWNFEYPAFFAVENDTLIVRYALENGICRFEFPVFGKSFQDEDIDSALNKIDTWCMENNCRPVFVNTPQVMIEKLMERYPHYSVSEKRNRQDYIYNSENLCRFAGKHYSGQRNHINKFKTLYPSYTFRKLNTSDNLDDFWVEYINQSNKNTEEALKELSFAKNITAFSMKDDSVLMNGCIEIDGKIAAISVGEVCGSMLIIHIEKALRNYEGIYPLIVNEFAKSNCNEKVTLINREDDGGDMGLRTSKMQYRPTFMGKKFRFEVSDNVK